jgi:hypothetical protein
MPRTSTICFNRTSSRIPTISFGLHKLRQAQEELTLYFPYFIKERKGFTLPSSPDGI